MSNVTCAHNLPEEEIFESTKKTNSELPYAKI